ALVDPHVLPSGIFAQFSIVAYGLGRSLTGWTLPWAPGFSVNIVNAVTIASASMILNRPDCDIAYPPLNDLLNIPNGSWGMVKVRPTEKLFFLPNPPNGSWGMVKVRPTEKLFFLPNPPNGSWGMVKVRPYTAWSIK